MNTQHLVTALSDVLLDLPVKFRPRTAQNARRQGKARVPVCEEREEGWKSMGKGKGEREGAEALFGGEKRKVQRCMSSLRSSRPIGAATRLWLLHKTAA